MPAFLAMLLGGFIRIAGSAVGSALVALGVSAVTYVGASSSINWLKDRAVASALALPPEVVGMLSVLKVGSCISLIFSAMLARLVVNGLKGDKVKKWVLK